MALVACRPRTRVLAVARVSFAITCLIAAVCERRLNIQLRALAAGLQQGCSATMWLHGRCEGSSPDRRRCAGNLPRDLTPVTRGQLWRH